MNGRKLFLNLGAASASRLISAALAIIQYWWLANRLPAADLGAFALMMSLYGTLQLLPLLGLNVPMTREIAVTPGRLRRSVSQHWWFAMPNAFLMGGGLILYGHWAHEATLEPVFWAVGLALVPTAWTIVAESTLMARDKLRLVALTNVAESAWRLVGSLLVLLLGGGLTAVLGVFLTGRLLSAALYLLLTDTPRPRLRLFPRLSDWQMLWGRVPMFLSIAALAAIAPRLDMLLLSHLVSMQQLAHYSAAARIFEAGMMIPTLAAIVVLPSLARLFTQDRQAFVRVVPEVIRAMFLVGSIAALSGAALIPWLFGTFFPPAFSEAALFAQILVCVVVLATVDLLLSSAMLADDAQRANLTSLGCGVAALAVTLLVLVPFIGPLGAAIAMVAQMVTSLLLRLRWCRYSLGARGIWPILAAALFSLAVGLLALRLGTVIGPVQGPLFAIGCLLVAALLSRLLRLVDFYRLGALPAQLRGPAAP